jgi:hypothetical protein
MKYIDRLPEHTVSAGYLWLGNTCIGKIVSVSVDFYTVIPS